MCAYCVCGLCLECVESKHGRVRSVLGLSGQSVADVMRYTCASSVDGPAVTGARLNYAAALDASVGEGDLPPGKQRVADCSAHVSS